MIVNWKPNFDNISKMSKDINFNFLRFKNNETVAIILKSDLNSYFLTELKMFTIHESNRSA